MGCYSVLCICKGYYGVHACGWAERYYGVYVKGIMVCMRVDGRNAITWQPV